MVRLPGRGSHVRNAATPGKRPPLSRAPPTAASAASFSCPPHGGPTGCPARRPRAEARPGPAQCLRAAPHASFSSSTVTCGPAAPPPRAAPSPREPASSAWARIWSFAMEAGSTRAAGHEGRAGGARPSAAARSGRLAHAART
jgi:hypothetical protein